MANPDHFLLENIMNNKNNDTEKTKKYGFYIKRIVVGIFLIAVFLWIMSILFGFFNKEYKLQVTSHDVLKQDEKKIAAHSDNSAGHTADHKNLINHDFHEDMIKPHDDYYGVGKIIANDFIILKEDTTAGEAVKLLQKEHLDIQIPLSIYVLDTSGKLAGESSSKQIQVVSPKSPLKDFMSTDIHTVNEGMKENEIAEFCAQHNLKRVPVVDSKNNLVGIMSGNNFYNIVGSKTDKPVTEAKDIHLTKDLPEQTAPRLKERMETESHEESKGHELSAKTTEHKVKGEAFVEACIKPLDYELHERFWGWRPNDIVNITDNINNFQLGVLEVTRRTAIILNERISRTGSTDSFDRNLERAMNWFMIKSDRYWFPSPESKYSAGLKELNAYKEKLKKGNAKFYTRTDNLIPLLAAYEDLLGSCEENLVKTKEKGGDDVSFFKADDYFFYAKGVATAMRTILEAVAEDFHITVDTRRGKEVLHHAIEACHHALEIDPILITNSSLSGILANHRANMAAPISHARFYIGVLIKTLST